jgi:hypothetical protein
MKQQRLVWTTLPRGLSADGKSFLFSAFVSPRLLTDSTSPTLALFPDWTDWPATVRSMSFALVPTGSAPIPATVVSAAPDSASWQRLFAGSARVESFVWQAYSGRRIWSYPAGKVRDYLVSTYSTLISKHPTAPPANSALVGFLSSDVEQPVPPGLLGAVAFGQRYAPLPGQGASPDSEDQAAAEIETELNRSLAIAPGQQWSVSAPGRYELLQAKLFHQPRTPIAPGTTTGGLVAPVLPALDFHQVVSLIGDHPALQRLFGLVIDLQAPVGAVKANGGFALRATWTPQLGAASTKQAYPKSLTDTTFLPAARIASSLVKHGALQLQESSFSNIELDVDGATRKLLTTARVLWNRAQGYLTTPATPETATVASLRSGGLAVAWQGLAWLLAESGSGTLAFQDQLNALEAGGSGGSIKLGAEDLTRGWRVDVYDQGSGRWYQLCARQSGPSGGYLIGNPAGSPVPVPAGDEGFVQLAPTGDSSGASTDLYLQEVVFRWNGWSLIAPRPGGQLDTDPTSTTPVVPDPGNPASPDFPISITYAVVPGTLPRLRFGHTYRFRARAVDVGGNSLAFDPTGTAASLAVATKPVTYLRLEPVASPQLLMRKPVTAGESVEVVVIRSNYDIPDTSVTPAQRHVAPPPFSVLQAEEHGLLDQTSGLPDPGRYAMLKNRDGAAFAGGTADPVNRGALYFDRDNLGVPYLSDIFARGAAFSGVPGAAAGSVVQVPFSSTSGVWPLARTVRLVVAAGSAAPVLPSTAAGAALTVSVPKGMQVPVSLSSYPDLPDLDLMALWQWAPATFRASAANQTAASSGGMWMLSPNRSLLLVHAVRQPNIAPQLKTNFAAVRTNLGDTTAQVTGGALVDWPSTDRVDVVANWSEPVDTGSNPDPVNPQPFSADLGRVTVTTSSGPTTATVTLGTAAVPMVQHFGDTKRHNVAYSALATTRYAKYFQEQASITLHAGTPAPLPNLLGSGVAPGTVTVEDPSGTPAYTEGTDYTVDYAAGTVALISGGAIPDGSTVLVAYNPAPITRSSLEVEPAGRAITIPNSANPTKPSVRSVLPAWALQAMPSPTSPSSTRKGGVLRVYLDRPWWSSGPDELLAVVLDVDSGDVTTGYGRDPLHPSGAFKGAIPADFPLAAKVSGTLFLPGGHGPIRVVGHTVSFDSTRNLWFADIEIKPLASAYFPFVQLVLVRYQPASLSGAELSPSVVLDMAQAVPNRTLVTIVTGVNPTQPSPVPVHLTGALGPGPYGQPNVVKAVVQSQSGGTDDLNWIDAAPAVNLHLTSGTNPIATWKGTVTRPAGSGPFRVLVTESEQYYRGPSAPGSTSPGGGIGERVVYADVLAL